jgi:hypothetical protein
MTLSTVIFVSGQVVGRRPANRHYFWAFLFVYYTFMFFGFFMIIKLAVRSWIPGLPSQGEEALEASPDSLTDSTDYETMERAPESMFIYLLYMICKVGNSFLASIVLFLLLWISVAMSIVIYQISRSLRRNGPGQFGDLAGGWPEQHDSQTILQRLKKIPYTQMLVNMGDSRECVVCLCEFVDGDDVLQLKCSKHHIFHYECLKQWIQSGSNRQGQCPICRARIRTDSFSVDAG